MNQNFPSKSDIGNSSNEKKTKKYFSRFSKQFAIARASLKSS